jgi:hypothetical protein
MISYANDPKNPAQALIETLKFEEAVLKTSVPKDSEIVATAIFTDGQELKIISAYARDPDIVVFKGKRGRERQTIIVITRYSLIAQCVFRIEKLKPNQRPLSLGFGRPPAEAKLP